MHKLKGADVISRNWGPCLLLSGVRRLIILPIGLCPWHLLDVLPPRACFARESFSRTYTASRRPSSLHIQLPHSSKGVTISSLLWTCPYYRNLLLLTTCSKASTQHLLTTFPLFTRSCQENAAMYRKNLLSQLVRIPRTLSVIAQLSVP